MCPTQNGGERMFGGDGAQDEEGEEEEEDSDSETDSGSEESDEDEQGTSSEEEDSGDETVSEDEDPMDLDEMISSDEGINFDSESDKASYFEGVKDGKETRNDKSDASRLSSSTLPRRPTGSQAALEKFVSQGGQLRVEYPDDVKLRAGRGARGSGVYTGATERAGYWLRARLAVASKPRVTSWLRVRCRPVRANRAQRVVRALQTLLKERREKAGAPEMREKWVPGCTCSNGAICRRCKLHWNFDKVYTPAENRLPFARRMEMLGVIVKREETKDGKDENEEEEATVQPPMGRKRPREDDLEDSDSQDGKVARKRMRYGNH
ncbi:hypothetical protein ABW19_dt0208135 [Dactylella cylindrospora]|nr:hypothetical protein ABW19_dt0208135 [Dactylella cylindrospora]